MFARKARQVLSIPEHQIRTPSDALNTLVQNPSTPIMFVDDFVGSGNQMVATWRRQYQIESGYKTSFSDVSHPDTHVVYVPLVATRQGLHEIKTHCPQLTVQPGIRS